MDLWIYMNKIPIFKINLYKSRVKHVASIDIKNIFNFKIKTHVILELIYWYRAKIRKGCAQALSKGNVNGTGKKPFAQKGRGIARQGSLKNPHQKGGGVAFPPIARKYNYKINKKKKYIAMQSIFALRLREKRVTIINCLTLTSPSTKIISTLIKHLNFNKVLFIDSYNSNLKLSTKNIKNAKFLFLESINIFDFVLFPYIVITKYAFSKLLFTLFPKFLR